MFEHVQLDFDPQSLVILNVILGLVMFGIALELTPSDFKRILRHPRAAILGLTSQIVLLPAVTYGLTMVLRPEPSLALGMILVAACPGGNMSNFFTHLSRGNSGLSITMTSIVTLGAVFLTPFNITFWGSLNPDTAPILREVALDPVRMVMIVGLILALPVALGMVVRAKKPEWADRMVRPFKIGSIVVFALFIVIALAKNFEPFLTYIDAIFAIVLIHNAIALLLGYGVARLGGVRPANRRALTIEVGIQNSGLGLVLIFTFFEGQGGMALIAAWWGVWHLIAGLTLGSIWARRALPSDEDVVPTG